MDLALPLVVLALLLAVGIGVLLASKRKVLPPPRTSRDAGTQPLAETKAGDAAKPSEQPGATTPGAEPALQADRAATPATPDGEPGPTVPQESETPERRASDEQQRLALKKGLSTTRSGLISRLAKLFTGNYRIEPALLDAVEEVLISADVGTKTTAKLLDKLRERAEAGELSSEEQIWLALKDEARALLSSNGAGPRALGSERPAVIVVVGVNGAGKTTTIGKLASKFQEQGKRVLLAAADTFRAAAVLQLEVWGRRVGCPVVKGKERADPGSVVFEAINRAAREDFDIVIADTAGRLHTKVPLMDELKKVHRTAMKALGGRPPDEVLLVLDSTTGQNAIQQAHTFRQALDISGIVLTKLDGTAKGGVILGIADEHSVPVRYIGLGEGVEDLREFEAGQFAEVLFAKPDSECIAA